MKTPNSPRLLAVVLTSALAISACGSDANETATTTAATTATTAAPATTVAPAEPAPTETAPADSEPANGTAGFPLTVANCDREITFDAPPQRVMIMESAAPSLLFAAGAIDRVIGRIEDFPTEYYTPDQIESLDEIPSLQAEATSTGGVEVSIESIIAYEPELIIGYETETLTVEALADVGIDMYVIPAFCGAPPKPSFDSIADEVRLYGSMFGTSDIADPVADELSAAVKSAYDNPVASGKTAAALYVSSDGSAVYGYSSLGMVHPQLEALGMTNVFADLSERVPEVSIEELIAANPDVLVLLYDDTGMTPEQITALVTDLPGASAIAAVSSGETYPLLFNYSEPPTPLVIKGLEILSERLAG
jgi:iron complex transport system substrate-binding protein